MRKPGETAPEAGAYYCYICALRGETSTCDLKAGEMFVECPKCLERKVPEWDLTWKAEKHRPDSSEARSSLPWPGTLGRSS
jgi:hypothetical protein